MLKKEISVADWESGTAQILRNLSVYQYAVGVGGAKQMDWKDQSLISGQLNFQLQKLRGFSNEILRGELTEKQIRARIQLYYNKTRGLYELGRQQGHRRNGYLWERRVLSNVENCAECITYANTGWVTIGTLPNIGDRCSCKANCKCSFYYSNSLNRPK
jgi:hypothetical protein